MPAEPLLYLCAGEVARALESIDVIEAVTAALAAHGRGATDIPAEAYLGWEHAGETLRSLSMPGLVDGTAGVKIINANPANPRAHEHGTGPELLAQFDGDLDAVVVPVSTGGTLAGIARFLRRESVATRIVAVDAFGSVALGGHPGPRLR